MFVSTSQVFVWRGKSFTSLVFYRNGAKSLIASMSADQEREEEAIEEGEVEEKTDEEKVEEEVPGLSGVGKGWLDTMYADPEGESLT